MDELKLIGARQNNLQSLSLTIPHNQLVVITGVSGSGKSTLAFDTIYAEGQRRYVETFSPYTRQFLDRLHPPDVDVMTGVRPALALEQRTRITNSRSTVGTVTEINDYLKVIWCHLGTLYCPTCEQAILVDTPSRILSQILDLANTHSISSIALCFDLSFQTTVSIESIRQTLISQGFVRHIDPKTKTIRGIEEMSHIEKAPVEKSTAFSTTIVVDRIKRDATQASQGFNSTQLLTSIEQAYSFGKNSLKILFYQDNPASTSAVLTKEFCALPICSQCKQSFPVLKPYHFSFNSPLGACETCKGFGRVLTIDVDRCVPDQSKSIENGAVACWSTKSTKREFRKLKSFCADQEIDTTIPWGTLPERSRTLIFSGPPKKRGTYRGIRPWFEKLQKKIYKMHVRVFLSRYRQEVMCEDCQGTRLRKATQAYRIQGKTLPQIWQLPVAEVDDFFRSFQPPSHLGEALKTALHEVSSRIGFLREVGLEYLTLDRRSRTLSGGESQRVNLTTILGSQIVNTTLVLDEPSIGLHARDTARLLCVLQELKKRGNSLIVVEHDRDVMEASDQIIDLGPDAGAQGGKVVFQGSFQEIKQASRSPTASLTGQYLSGQLHIPRYIPRLRDLDATKNNFLHITGANVHNLKNIDVSIPLQQLVAITGVSGSGKSTLVHQCLAASYNEYQATRHGGDTFQSKRGSISQLRGLSHIKNIVVIDQSPVGKSPRSNPATYTKAWDIIREHLADTPQAQQLGLSKSSFSFNVDSGRCASCKGAGYHRIEMQFLADVFVKCEFCNGERFKAQVLGVKYRGKNVLDFLEMTVQDVANFFQEQDAATASQIQSLVKPLLDLGLGYLRFGQPLNTVSGGEAQRIKLASFLSDQSMQNSLFILDEPTTGLHIHNVSQLLDTLRQLIKHGHSVVVVEHNLDFIEHCDWIIDLGPEGGENGGRMVVQGVPQILLETPTTVAKSHTLIALAKKAATQMPIALSGHFESARHEAMPILVKGARHHNLKDVTITIPKDKLIVFTGVSGSGKSTLAFDILFAEGQRRYIESLSPYARQFLTHLTRADVDLVESLPPTIALSQKTAPPLGISTLATTTEVYQYLRLLYAKVGIQHCPKHKVPITVTTTKGLADAIIQHAGVERVFLFAPVVLGRKGHYQELFQRAVRAEIREARVDGKITTITSDTRLERHKTHWVSLLVASLTNPAKHSALFEEAIEQCLTLGAGYVEVALSKKQAEPVIFSSERICPVCRTGFRPLDPQDFSFRSARGACQLCSGLGYQLSRNKTRALCRECSGARIGPNGRNVYIEGQSISELCQRTAPDLLSFLESVDFESRLKPVVSPVMIELKNRLRVISAIGLDYLELDRESASISGGEAQRLRLARTLGSPLTGVCYVLDEPTIGLHPQDHQLLLHTLTQLRDAGNTVVIVEHDEETIRAADYIIDVGPGGGAQGGEIVCAGTLDDILYCPASVTGAALRLKNGKLASVRNDSTTSYLELSGASAHNLKHIGVKIPLQRLTVVVGVSGAGKSSLVHGSLIPALIAKRSSPTEKQQATWERISNFQGIDRYIEIDQKPVGKTTSSIPASYVGILDEIRRVFSLLPEAKARGWGASFFSFNVTGGRCENCRGKGVINTPMTFLPDAISLCEECEGKRYRDITQDVKYQGYSIADILQRTFREALEVFEHHPKIKKSLDYVLQLGLGYLTLGQPTYTLSGGEAQRLKIARELSTGQASNTLYFLDEPTTGLHMADIDKLLRVLRQLVSRGNTVLVIEHNLDFIAQADHLLELGPGAGDKGGQVIFAGTPAAMLESKVETPTKKYLLRYAAERAQNEGQSEGQRQEAIHQAQASSSTFAKRISSVPPLAQPVLTKPALAKPASAKRARNINEVAREIT